MENIYLKSEGMKPNTVELALAKISEQDLKENNWPILTKVSKLTFRKYNDRFDVSTIEEEQTRELNFWREIFNKENFIIPSAQKFNPESDILFILHSVKNNQGTDSEFIAVTTTYDSFIKDPVNLINYNLHGKPCSIRSNGSYPRKDFWDFYDSISEEEQGEYVIADTNGREYFYKENG